MALTYQTIARLQINGIKLFQESWRPLLKRAPVQGGKHRNMNKPVLICHRCMSAQYKRVTQKKTIYEKGYLMLAIPAITFGLGTWQVQRREWKLKLIADLEKRTQAEPVAFPTNLEDLEDLEYKKVVVRGTFDHSKEILIQPRSRIDPGDSRGNAGGGLISGSDTAGAHVITPFRLSDQNLTILVNRGWVSRKRLKAETRQSGQIGGEVMMVGVVRHTEKRQPFGAKNDPRRNHWSNRDIDEISDFLSTDPVFIDACDTVPGGPLGSQTRVTLRNEHLTYIFTWYSLSAITAFMWFKMYFAK